MSFRGSVNQLKADTDKILSNVRKTAEQHQRFSNYMVTRLRYEHAPKEKCLPNVSDNDVRLLGEEILEGREALKKSVLKLQADFDDLSAELIDLRRGLKRSRWQTIWEWFKKALIGTI